MICTHYTADTLPCGSCCLVVSRRAVLILVYWQGISSGKRSHHFHALQSRVHTAGILPLAVSQLSHSLGRNAVVLLGLFCGIGVSGVDLVHGVAQLCLDEQQQANASAHGGRAVVGRLGGEVGEVDAFAKGIAVGGGLWRSNPQSLGQNSTKIRGS